VNTIWVLIAVFVYPSNTATSFSQEFLTQGTCETAKESIREKATGGKFILLTCERK